jgi:hypothetical protein
MRVGNAMTERQLKLCRQKMATEESLLVLVPEKLQMP